MLERWQERKKMKSKGLGNLEVVDIPDLPPKEGDLYEEPKRNIPEPQQDSRGKRVFKTIDKRLTGLGTKYKEYKEERKATAPARQAAKIERTKVHTESLKTRLALRDQKQKMAASMGLQNPFSMQGGSQTDMPKMKSPFGSMGMPTVMKGQPHIGKAKTRKRKSKSKPKKKGISISY